LKTVLQVEFSPSLLLDREAVLKRAGYQVISVLGSSNARSLEVSDSAIGVIVIGHGALRLDRQDLIAHFRETLPGIPIVALFRSTDDPFSDVDFNCPADNPPLWERTVTQALGKAG
jgi:DNA-binding NtrC family response regulator